MSPQHFEDLRQDHLAISRFHHKPGSARCDTLLYHIARMVPGEGLGITNRLNCRRVLKLNCTAATKSLATSGFRSRRLEVNSMSIDGAGRLFGVLLRMLFTQAQKKRFDFS
jgi:hypothetical protein